MIIVSGCVRSYKALSDGRRQIVGFLCAGDLIGHLADRHVASFEALDDVTVCSLPKARLTKACETAQPVMSAMNDMLRNQIVRALDVALSLGRKSALERVAWFLLDFARHGGVSEITLPMTRQDIGDFLGLRIETVSRELTRLRKMGAIAVTPKSFRILCADKLESASGEPKMIAA